MTIRYSIVVPDMGTLAPDAFGTRNVNIAGLPVGTTVRGWNRPDLESTMSTTVTMNGTAGVTVRIDNGPNQSRPTGQLQMLVWLDQP